MARVADVRLKWTRSPSADVSRADVVVTNAGSETTTSVGPEVEELMLVVRARDAVQFKVIVFDGEGNRATSETYSFSLGDLEVPLPATALTHEVVAVRDVPDEPPPAPTP